MLCEYVCLKLFFLLKIPPPVSIYGFGLMYILFLSTTRKKEKIMLYEHSVEAKLVYLTLNKKKTTRSSEFFCVLFVVNFYNNFSVDETKYISTPCIWCNYTVSFLNFVVADGFKQTQQINSKCVTMMLLLWL